MARFALMSAQGGLLWLARRLVAEGHDVHLHIREEPYRTIGQGLVPVSGAGVPADDATVVFDEPLRGRMGAAYRARGLGVIGGNALDEDFADGGRAAQLLRITHRVPQTQAHRDTRLARAYLATKSGRWRVGPISGGGPRYADEAAQLVPWLRWASDRLLGGVLMQREHTGECLAIVGWFDGERFVPPFAHVLDQEGFVAVEARETSAAVSELRKLSGLLGAAHFVGPLRLDLVLDREGLMVCGATAVPDHTWPALSLLWDGDLGAQLVRFAKGNLKRLDVREDATSVTLDVSVAAPASAGMPLDKALGGKGKTLLPAGVRLKDGEPVLAHGMLVARVGAVGKDAVQAAAGAVTAAEKLWVPYRERFITWRPLFPKLPEPAPLRAARTRDQADAPASAPPPPPFSN